MARLPKQGHERAKAMIRYDYQSPIGVLALVADDAALRGLSFEGGKHGGPPPMRNRERTRSSMRRVGNSTPISLDAARHSICRSRPTAPTSKSGSGACSRRSRSARRVLMARSPPRSAPRGRRGQLARRTDAIRSPSSSVHRVIGADGSLTGFGGGMERKRFLLALEGGEPALLWT